MDIKESYGKLVSKIKEAPPGSLLNSMANTNWLTPQLNELKSTFNQSTIYNHTSNFLSKLQFGEKYSAIASLETLALYEELKPYLGCEIHRSDWHEITQNQIDNFALATGDHQWIHTDTIRAKKESPFRSTIAHGFLLVSLLPVLRDTAEGSFKNARLHINCGIEHLKFEHPVKPGQRFQAIFELCSVILGKRHIELSERVTIVLNTQQRTVLTAVLLSRIYTRG